MQKYDHRLLQIYILIVTPVALVPIQEILLPHCSVLTLTIDSSPSLNENKTSLGEEGLDTPLIN